MYRLLSGLRAGVRMVGVLLLRLRDPEPGPPPPWGVVNVFVQVDVYDVKAHVSGTTLTQEGIQVCAVVIQEATRVVYQRGNVFNFVFKYAKCVGGWSTSNRRLRPSVRCVLRSSTSTVPRSVDFIAWTAYPQIAAVAGFCGRGLSRG